MIITVQGDVDATVHGVKKTRQYVLHSAQLHSGAVHVGDYVTLLVDKVLSSSANTNCSSALTARTAVTVSVITLFLHFPRGSDGLYCVRPSFFSVHTITREPLHAA